MKYVILVNLFIGVCWGNLPEQYHKKNYVEIGTKEIEGRYYHSYNFKDEKNELTKWQWWISIQENDTASEAFGIDLKYVQGNKVQLSEANKNYFILRGSRVGIDYTGLLNLYRDSAYPLYKKFKEHSLKNKLTKRQEIEFLLRFFQDFPYGVVPATFGGKFTNGLMPTTEIFKTGWSDCDSKSLLMAAILSHDPYYYDKLAMITVPQHALLGIQGIPRPYDKYATFRGKKYIYAEPVGITRTPFGRTNSPYNKSMAVYPMKVYSYTEKSEPVNLLGKNEITDEDCFDGGVVIDYTSEYDGVRTVACRIKLNGEVVGHGPEIVYDKLGKRTSYKILNNGIEVSSETSDPDVDQNVSSFVDNSPRVNTDLTVLTQDNCPGDTFLIDYDTVDGKKSMCVKQVDGKIIKHGPAIYYNTDGTVKESLNFENDQII